MSRLFGLSSNQQDAVNRARNELKAAQNSLREAKKILDATPRTENGKATDAVRQWERAVRAAAANLSAAEAVLRLANR